MSRNSWASAGAALAVAALLTGCVSQGPLGVRVAAGGTDVAFGAPTKPPLPNFPSPPAQQPQPQPQQQFPNIPPIEVPNIPPLPDYTAPPAQSCPAAAINAFPEKSATDSITTLPEKGAYRWKQSGKVSVGNAKLSLAGFQAREIRNVTGAAGSQTFQQVEPDAATGSLYASTFDVKPTSAQPAVPPAANPEGLPVPNADPAGLRLTEVDSIDAKGTATPVLRPQPALLYLPTPVAPATTFTSRAVNAVDGAALTMTGTVKGRMRVDACGTEIDGWLVEATQSFQPKSGGTMTSRTYNYIIATQLGGILISEQIRSGTTVDAQFSIGQLHPSTTKASSG